MDPDPYHLSGSSSSELITDISSPKYKWIRILILVKSRIRMPPKIPIQIGSRIQIHIKVKNLIRISLECDSRIRIPIKVESRAQILIRAKSRIKIKVKYRILIRIQSQKLQDPDSLDSDPLQMSGSEICLLWIRKAGWSVSKPYITKYVYAGVSTQIWPKMVISRLFALSCYDYVFVFHSID